MLKYIRLQNKNFRRTRRNIGIMIGINIGISALEEIEGGKFCVVLHHTLSTASSQGLLLRHGRVSLAPCLDLWLTGSLYPPFLYMESPVGQAW